MNQTRRAHLEGIPPVPAIDSGLPSLGAPPKLRIIYGATSAESASLWSMAVAQARPGKTARNPVVVISTAMASRIMPMIRVMTVRMVSESARPK